MRKKMQELLDNPGFKEALANFKNSIRSNTSDSDVEEQLHRLLKSLPPEANQRLEVDRVDEAVQHGDVIVTHQRLV